MANKTINDFTTKTGITITDRLLIQEADGTTKKVIGLTSYAALNGTFETFIFSDANSWLICDNPYSNGSVGALGFLSSSASGNDFIMQTKNGITFTGFITKADGKSGFMTKTPAHVVDVVGTAGLSTGTTWTNTCDKRLKEDIEDADLDICYDNIKNLKLKYFKLKDEYFDKEKHPDRHKVGWVADDVKEVFNKSVGLQKFIGTEKIGEQQIEVKKENGEVEIKIEPIFNEIDGCKNLNIDSIISAMYGTIQKIIEKVETLESQINGK